MFTDNLKAKGVMVAALLAAQQAAEKQNATLGDESSRGFDCGFAWVYFAGNSPFARWMKKNHPDMLSEGYPKGKQIWYSRLHSVSTQSVSVHEAACRAFRDVWASHGISLEVSSRLD